MIKTKLLTLFRTEASDSVEPYLWPTTDVLQWLNDAVDEACIRKLLILDDSTASICEIAVSDDGTSVYSLDDTVICVNKAYLVDGDDEIIYLDLKDRDGLDREFPEWRESEDDPSYLIVDETSVKIVPNPAEEFTMHLEVYRTTVSTEQLVEATDLAPAISPIHHKFLIHWVLHRAYSGRSKEKEAAARSASELGKFEDYFGVRSEAGSHRRARANHPRRNKLW